MHRHPRRLIAKGVISPFRIEQKAKKNNRANQGAAAIALLQFNWRVHSPAHSNAQGSGETGGTSG
jgi:hypothetical protein